jgi:hypothetical protein
LPVPLPGPVTESAASVVDPIMGEAIAQYRGHPGPSKGRAHPAAHALEEASRRHDDDDDTSLTDHTSGPGPMPRLRPGAADRDPRVERHEKREVRPRLFDEGLSGPKLGSPGTCDPTTGPGDFRGTAGNRGGFNSTPDCAPALEKSPESIRPGIGGRLVPLPARAGGMLSNLPRHGPAQVTHASVATERGVARADEGTFSRTARTHSTDRVASGAPASGVYVSDHIGTNTPDFTIVAPLGMEGVTMESRASCKPHGIGV